MRHGRFWGAGFSFSRMSWIKPNFSVDDVSVGVGDEGENQEATLGLRVRRDFFEEILGEAVPSSWDRGQHASEAEWSAAVGRSAVRLQWDPDHGPTGEPLERRAIQLGLRGEMLRRFSDEELLEVVDLSDFVAEQRGVLAARGKAGILVPRERVFWSGDKGLSRRLGLDVD